MASSGFHIHIVIEQFEWQAGGLRGLIGEHDGCCTRIDHHRRDVVVNFDAQSEIALVAARDFNRANGF